MWRAVPGIAGVYAGVVTHKRQTPVWVLFTEVIAVSIVSAEQPFKVWIGILALTIYLLCATPWKTMWNTIDIIPDHHIPIVCGFLLLAYSFAAVAHHMYATFAAMLGLALTRGAEWYIDDEKHAKEN